MAEALRIAVLDIAASKTGALSVLRDFYSYVLNRNDDNEWFFIIGVKGLIEEQPEKANIHVIVREDVKKSKFRRLFFDRFTGCGFLRELKADVIVSMQNTLPVGTEKLFRDNGEKVENVIYLHQPLGFQKIKKFSFFNKWERELALYQYLIAPEIDRSLKRADKVIVQTAWMKEAVCEKDGLPEERVHIVRPDVSSVLDVPEASSVESPMDAKLCKPEQAPGHERDKRLFIYPAGSILYKNHQCIVDAVRLLKGRGTGGFKVIFTEKKGALPWLNMEDALSDLIEFAGPLPREEVIGFYRKGTLLFPSYIETFGYPLAEARLIGAPIIAADTPFAREILDGYEAASFFDPFDAEMLSILMEESMGGS